MQSTIIGLGAFGYISSTQLTSTVTGLGTFGYISSTQLTSTVTGLGNIYLSTNIVPSTIVGLGAFGYISTNIVPSTIIGLGAFGYLSSFNSISSLNISSGNLITNTFTTNSVSTVNISSASNYTSVQFANSYNGITLGGNINMNGSVFPTTGGGVNRELGSITNRWNNFFVSTISSIHTTTSTLFVQTNIIASTINASTIGVHRLTGPENGFNTFTNNIFPISQSATIGYGSNLSNSGYYNQGNFRSTFTNVIQPATDSVQHANVVRINGTVSTNTLATYFLQGNSPFGRFVYTDSILPNGNVNIGNAVTNTFASIWGSNIRTDTIFSRFGDHPQSTVRILGTLSTGILNVSSIFAINVNASTIRASTIITPSISTNNISTIRLSVSSINSDLIPSVDNTYDLGSAISRWRDLYVAGTSIHLGNTLVLSETANGMLSTNNGIITPSVQAVGDIILKGTNIKTDGILDLSNNEILNVKQTNTLNSGATNVMARRVYFDSPSAVTINNTAYTNVLTDPPTKFPVFNNSNNFYKYLNCTFSFRADGIDDTLAYYFDLSNETNKTMATGIIFDATYPFIENGNTYITSNRSITVQEQFDTSITSPSWADTDQFFPRMYVQTSTLTKSLTNMKFSMVYEPIFE